MGRNSTKRIGALVALAAALSLLFGATAVAQEQVIIEDTGNQINSGEIVLQLGTSCFAEDFITVSAEVSNPDYPNISTAAIISQESILVQVPCDEPSEPDEVEGITQTPDEVLAYTGSDINRPISLGVALVGAGGLILAVAKRSESRDEELDDIVGT